jgi:drug/metabolite transporter (DMT)-like permease
MFKIIFLYALFASTFSLGKELLYYGPPIFSVGTRMTIAGLMLLLYQYFFADHSFKFKRKHLKYYIQGTLFAIYIHYILRFIGLQHMASYKASLLYNFGPFASFILAHFLIGEKVTYKKVLGLIVGFIGLLPVLIQHEPSEDIFSALSFISWPELAIIASVSCSSYGWIVLHKLIDDKDYAPAMINGITMFAGGILALFTSFAVEYDQPVTDWYKYVGILSIIIIVSNFIGHNLYGSLLKVYKPTFLSFASFLTPLFAAFYGWLFLGETITWQFYVSVVLVFCGLGLFYMDQLQEQYETQFFEDAY